MAVGGAHAVRTRIAAADHDDVLAVGADRVGRVACHFLVLRDQEFECVVHAVQVAARHRQVARDFRTAGQHHGIELLEDVVGGNRLARVVADAGGDRLVSHHHAGAEGHALGFHLLYAAVDLRFFQLEVGDAITQQAADAVVLLEQRHVVAGARQLLRRRQAGRARADHGHGLAGLVPGQLRMHPALGPRLVDDGVLDRLDADRRLIDAQRAGRLARCRTDAARELGEIVGRMQHLDRRLPVLAVHQVVEVGDDVVDRAAVVAERDATIHAARALDLGFAVRQREHELLVMLHARFGRFVCLVLAGKFEKAGRLAHGVLPGAMPAGTAILPGGRACLVRLRCSGVAGSARAARLVARNGQAAICSRALSCSRSYISVSARLYSVGKTLTKRRRALLQSASSSLARSEPV